MADVGMHSDLGEFVAVETGQNRHTQNQRRPAAQPPGGFLRGTFGGPHHRASAARVNRQHLHVQLHGGLNSPGHGVRDVMKFKIEEN